MHGLILTFDVEDFIDPNEMSALQTILELLDKQKLRALFFITGHMAEKLATHPMVLDLLKKHEIGFHSSGHSVRPTIPEFTDVESYAQARAISLERETAHINPLTGEAEGEGGIYLLQDLFHPKKIEAFRAPGMSWTPPHLEALREVGIRFDFSSNVTMSVPVQHGSITFYPYTFTQTWEGKPSDYSCLFSNVLKRQVSVFDLHPTQYVNQRVWDSIYHMGNPKGLFRAPERTLEEAKSHFSKFAGLLKLVNRLQKTRMINAEPSLLESTRNLIADENDVERYYTCSMRWPKKFFNYSPRFVRLHFSKFFESVLQ
jgi:peptidoglycan/xylan/chitin deacetylase (PgdA/CDA1 family)